MRRFSLAALAATVMLLTMSSCAKQETEDTNPLEQRAFDEWIDKYVNNNGIKAKKQPNGMYVEFISDGSMDLTTKTDTIVWLRLDYTATDLQNNVFVTRNEETALRQRTYTPRTYYVPDYMFCGKENYNMIKGQYYALKNELEKPNGDKIWLTEGAEIRLYLPSYLAFGSNGYSDDQGYGGQYPLPENTKPIIETLKITEVVKDPIKREEDAVLDHAVNKWGLGATDTLAAHFYVDTLYFRTNLKREYKEDYALTADSTAKIWFVGKFLDGFIFDTNIDSVYTRFYNRRASEGYFADSQTNTVLSYNPTSNENDYISAFFKAIPTLRKGQWSRIVFASTYGYGATGLSAALKQQQDYYNYYLSYMYSSYYNNSSYGNSYYGSYYNGYYGDYNYLGYSTSSSSEEGTEIVTEIQPYTPLIFEIYIESGDEEE